MLFNKFRNKSNLKKALANGNEDILIASSKIDNKLLASFKNCIIWPTYKLSKEKFVELTGLGYKIIEKDFDERFLKSKYFLDSNQYNLYYLDDLISGEVIRVFYLADKNNMKLYINTSIIVKNPNVIAFDIDRLISTELVNRIPVTYKLDDTFINKQYSCMESNKAINIFLVGYDTVNKELIKKHLMNNQLVAKYENGYESLKIKYFIISEKFNLYERDFIYKYQELKENIIQDEFGEYFVMFEEIGKFFYYEGHPYKKDALELMKYCLDNQNSFNYLYVSLDSKCNEFVKVFKETFKDNNNYQLIVNDPSLSKESDLLTYCNYKQALDFYFTANDKFDEVYDAYISVASKYLPYLKTSMNDMNAESIEFIKSSFLNLKIKYDMLGLKIKRKENCHADNVLTIMEYKNMLSKYRYSINAEEGIEYINQYVKDVFSKNLSKELSMSYHDHLKWCAFKLLHGYTPMKKKDCIRHKRIDYKDDVKKENIYLTQFYEIENVKEYLSYLSKTNEANFELSIYDALFTYIAYDVLDKLGYALEKK